MANWKRRERQAARILGAERNVGSGSCGRPVGIGNGVSASDSTHPTLFLETKSRASHAAVSLFDATRKLARKEGKAPVVALAVNGRPGILLVIDPADLPTVAAAYAEARREATGPGPLPDAL